MYTQFEAICNRLFSFWGQKLCCWQVYVHNLAQSMRWSHHTDGWVPEWGWGIDSDARKVCVCVWERERERERNHNTIWILLGSGTDLYFCLGGAHQKWWDASNTKVTACCLHAEGHQEVETQVRLEPGYPYWVFPSLWGNRWWSEQTRLLCRCPLLLWLPSQKLKAHITHLHCEQIHYCWINKGTALWHFIVCNELLK